jgi:(E)-4-hydroxy-3-methylbut-2-enyl-diphosphate synthase
LGVTEAGEGEDGRMKSAIGIGTLLMVIASLLIYVV